MTYPVESLLRPPVELVSAGVCTACALSALAAPSVFMMTPTMSIYASFAFLSFGAFRLRQGLQILRYHRNLKRLPVYMISPGEVPVSNHKLFLGRGFKWDERHTQRLTDTRTATNRRYVEASWLSRQARSFEFRYEHLHWARPLSKITKAPHWGPFGLLTNPIAPPPPVGGTAAIHGVEIHEADVVMDLVERVGHTLVLGTTRVGKTRLAELLICQDIRRGDVVIVFDPKGDAELLRRMYAEALRSGREEEFSFFHLGYPDISARYNGVGSTSRITEVATRLAGQLPSEGQSAAFREFVWRFVNVLARALVALGRKPSYATIYANAVHVDQLAKDYLIYWLETNHPDWRDTYSADEATEKELIKQAQKTGRDLEALQLLAYIGTNGWNDPIADGLASVLSNDRSYFEKLVSSLYPLLEKLTTGKTAALLSPDYDDPHDPRPIFDWMGVINKGGIVYVGLDSLSDFEVAGAVGNSMFADLTSTAGQIYKFNHGYGQSTAGKRRKVCIHADEFNELIGDEFIPLLNKSGGADYQVTAYTQTWSDVEAKIGSAAKAGQIGGNFNTLVMMRVKNVETAEILTNQLPEVNIMSIVPSSAATDTNDPREFAEFASKAEDRLTPKAVPMLTPSDLVVLPKGQAFALIEGGQLYKIRLPLFDTTDDDIMPPDLTAIASDMDRIYARYVDGLGDLVVEGAGSGF
jgi:conjugative coupling factor TraD (TOL family)